MPVQMLHRIIRFLDVLESIQKELESLYELRLAAMVAADPRKMQSLDQQEVEVTSRLRRQLQQRKTILNLARRDGLPSDDLRTLLRSLHRFVSADSSSAATDVIDPAEYRQTTEWMRRVERRSWKLRRDSWSNWHAIRRGYRESTAIRNLLANCGERAAAEGHDQRSSTATGGALLDTKI